MLTPPKGAIPYHPPSHHSHHPHHGNSVNDSYSFSMPFASSLLPVSHPSTLSNHGMQPPTSFSSSAQPAYPQPLEYQSLVPPRFSPNFCIQCQQPLSSSYALKRHIKLRYIAGPCTSMFVFTQRHPQLIDTPWYKAKFPVKKRQHCCPECLKPYAHYTNMRRHYRNVHGKNKAKKNATRVAHTSSSNDRETWPLSGRLLSDEM